MYESGREGGIKDGKLLIIDGYGLVFRAFFAIKTRLSTADGIPTNAVYGFVKMTERLLSQVSHTHVVVVFDSGSKSFRSEVFPQYKANRATCPDDLKSQFSIVREAADAMSLQTLEAIGFEADDVIAQCVRVAELGGLPTTIATSDKDLLQLVRDGKTDCFDPMKGIFLRESDIFARFSVQANQLADWLALVGDASDNIPGVGGIGPKNASELLREFGQIENLYNSNDKIANKAIRVKLERGRESAILSQKLTHLNVEVPMEIKADNFVKVPRDWAKFEAFLDKYQFNLGRKKTVMTNIAPDNCLF